MLATETSNQSDVRRSLIQEIEQTSDYLLGEVLDFRLFVRAKHSQDETDIDYEDIADAKAALASIDSEGTISWETLKTVTTNDASGEDPDLPSLQEISEIVKDVRKSRKAEIA